MTTIFRRGEWGHVFVLTKGEAQKCVLLCANRHAEVENGVVALPLQ